MSWVTRWTTRWGPHGSTRRWTPELRADAWAGCILARDNLTPADLQEALAALSEFPSPSHPNWNLRLPVIRSGYAHCGGAAPHDSR